MAAFRPFFMMEFPAEVVLRVDASSSIGVGHAFRARAIAAAAQARGLSAKFVTSHMPNELAHLLVGEGHAVVRIPCVRGVVLGEVAWNDTQQSEDAASTVETFGAGRPRAVIVDHFSLSAPWHESVSSATDMLVSLDEMTDRVDASDVLVDPSPGAVGPKQRRRLRDGIELRGPMFAPLHPLFGRLRSQGLRKRNEVRRILINFGGATNASLIADAVAIVLFATQRDVMIDVVTGVAGSAEDLNLSAHERVSVHQFGTDFATWMEASDLMIGAGGSTLWERCTLGLPSLTIATAANQVAASKTLDRLGGTVFLGDVFKSPSTRERTLQALDSQLRTICRSPELVGSLSARAASVTDGRGADRILSIALGGERVTEPAWRHQGA